MSNPPAHDPPPPAVHVDAYVHREGNPLPAVVVGPVGVALPPETLVVLSPLTRFCHLAARKFSTLHILKPKQEIDEIIATNRNIN